MKEIAKFKIFIIIFSIIFGIVSSIYYPIPKIEPETKFSLPLFDISKSVLPVIVGFFITSISIISLFENEINKLSAKVADEYKNVFYMKLERYTILCIYFITTIVLGCIVENFYGQLPFLKYFVIVYVFLCSSSLVGTIFLPIFIKELVLEKYQLSLEVRKILAKQNEENQKIENLIQHVEQKKGVKITDKKLKTTIK